MLAGRGIYVSEEKINNLVIYETSELYIFIIILEHDFLMY